MKRTLKFQEYQSAIVSEFQLLNQLADQTEYGRQGFTVVDRKKELSRKSDVNMDMMKTCKNAWASDTNLSQLFQQRSQALGEYEAYRQIYAMIKTGTIVLEAGSWDWKHPGRQWGRLRLGVFT